MIPTANEPGADTWQVKKSALTGGGGTWTALTLDVTRNEVLVPVGNPAPDLDAEYRPGDNLYTDSVVALDAGTGELHWYHQFKAHDGVDHDLAAAPVLYRTPDLQDIVAAAGKDGMLVGLDRESHKELIAYSPLHELTTEDWMRVLNVNQTGVFLGMRAVVPAMQRQKAGSIINVSSIWGNAAVPGAHAYHATKGAVRNMTKTPQSLMSPTAFG